MSYVSERKLVQYAVLLFASFAALRLPRYWIVTPLDRSWLRLTDEIYKSYCCFRRWKISIGFESRCCYSSVWNHKWTPSIPFITHRGSYYVMEMMTWRMIVYDDNGSISCGEAFSPTPQSRLEKKTENHCDKTQIEASHWKMSCTVKAKFIHLQLLSTKSLHPLSCYVTVLWKPSNFSKVKIHSCFQFWMFNATYAVWYEKIRAVSRLVSTYV